MRGYYDALEIESVFFFLAMGCVAGSLSGVGEFAAFLVFEEGWIEWRSGVSWIVFFYLLPSGNYTLACILAWSLGLLLQRYSIS